MNPILVLPYTGDFTVSAWVLPGESMEFYSMECDCLDPFRYFSYYYDSLIVYIKDHVDEPVKFYQDGSTQNYDESLNPFINPDVWLTVDNSNITKSSRDKSHVYEHYFSIEEGYIESQLDLMSDSAF